MDPSVLMGLIVVGFPLAFMAMWSLVLLILSSLSGWGELAMWYKAETWPDGAARKSGVSLAMGRGWLKVSYRSGVQIAVTKQGIGLKPILLLGLFHPPLFLPFSEIDARYEKKLLGRYYRITPNRSQAMGIFLPARVGEWVEVERGGFVLPPLTDLPEGS